MPEPVIVVHCNKPVPEGYHYIYIGRSCPLGNPYPITPEIDRAGVINAFKEDFEKALHDSLSPISKEYNKLLQMVTDGEKIALGCWCSPQACHGDVIKESLLIDVF
jgi:Domain of unknown function (DUF4326)